LADLDKVARVAAGGGNLAVLSTMEPDGSVHASLVSAGVLPDPIDESPGVAAVIRGDARKLRLLRASGQAAFTFTRGYEWASVSGLVRLIGPDDGFDFGLDVPALLRAVFRAAGGSHDDWDEYDHVMEQERRCAVFVRANRVTGVARD
jgi:PPOX class probable F420-dependent enzyme